MKKILLGLFILSNLSFANWEKIELIDEFEEKTGEVSAIAQMKNTGFIRVDKDKKGFSFYIYPNEYIGGLGNETEVKFKIDKNKPIKIYGYVTDDGKKVYVTPNSQLLSQMKNGDNMKMSILKYNNNTILKEVSLNNFQIAIEEVK